MVIPAAKLDQRGQVKARIKGSSHVRLLCAPSVSAATVPLLLWEILRHKCICGNATRRGRVAGLVGGNLFLQGGSPYRKGAGSGARDAISDAISDFDKILAKEALLWERDV